MILKRRSISLLINAALVSCLFSLAGTLPVYPKQDNSVFHATKMNGLWYWYVGPQKLRYKVYIKLTKKLSTTGYLIAGHMISPKGKRFDFKSCTQQPIYDDCSFFEQGNGRLGVISMSLYEGETLWNVILDKSKLPKLFINGEALHVETDKRQAVFSGVKIN